MGNLKQTELQRLKNRGKRKESLRIGREKIEQEDKTKEKVVRNRRPRETAPGHSKKIEAR